MSIDRIGNKDRAGLGEGLQSRRDIHTVAGDIVTLCDHVPKINADAELYAFFRRSCRVALGHSPLHLNRAAHRVHHALAKSKWKFTKAGEDWFCFAGLWRPMPDGGDAFTLLTTEPGPDVAPIHNRQMVVLDRADWLSWLDVTKPEPELLRPLPAGSLTVEQVRSTQIH